MDSGKLRSTVKGEFAQRFAPVAAVHADHLARGMDWGAALCIYHRGQAVVNIWSGHARAGQGWREDTLVPLTSITKPLLAIAVLSLAQEGALTMETPVCACWPEFADGGKSTITIGQALSHQAGLPAFDHAITLDEQIERRSVIAQLSAMRPMWSPGTAHGYHAITLGFIVTEILERFTGHTSWDIVRSRVAGPLEAEVSLGVRAGDILRVAATQPPAAGLAPNEAAGVASDYADALLDSSSLLHRATFGSTAMSFEDMNDPRYFTAPRPAAYGTAAGVARIFAALVGQVDGVRLLAPPWTDLARTPRADGLDRVFLLPTTWGLGFLLPGGPLMPRLARGAFGHLGSTGALAFADPENELAFAFLPNKMKSIFELPDRRAERLVDAVYRCL